LDFGVFGFCHFLFPDTGGTGESTKSFETGQTTKSFEKSLFQGILSFSISKHF